jgi:hypothetical protein
MARNTTKHSLPYALLSSTLGSILVSFAAVWLATSHLNAAGVGHSSYHSPSGPMFQLSPIPPGADWTSYIIPSREDHNR